APEKAYLVKMVDDGLASREGFFNITGGYYYAGGTNTAWNQGRNSATAHWSADDGGGGYIGGQIPGSLRQPGRPRRDMAQSDYGIKDSTGVYTASSLYEANYFMYALGRAKDLGYHAESLLSYFSQFYVGLATDPASNFWLLGNGRLPYQNADH